MKAKKYKTDVYVWLYPPSAVEEIGKHKIGLIRTLLLDFVPYPGLILRIEGKYPEKKLHHWGHLIKVARGPKGAVGLGFNQEIWPIDKVYYNVAKGRFEAACFPEMQTVEQLNAVQELMVGYHGFRVYFEFHKSRLPLSV